MIINCQTCGGQSEAKNPRKRFCSAICGQRSRKPPPRIKACGWCGAEFAASGPSDCNRRYCSKRCAKAKNNKRVRGWTAEQTARRRELLAARPSHHREHAQRQRALILEMLGGACVVCGVANPPWLHVDYIHGTRGSKHRHPRHLAFVRAHKDDFRILCANHHYELTLTGRIEGTDIIQGERAAHPCSDDGGLGVIPSKILGLDLEPLHQSQQQGDGSRRPARRPAADCAFVDVEEAGAAGLGQAQGGQGLAELASGHLADQSGAEQRVVRQQGGARGLPSRDLGGGQRGKFLRGVGRLGQRRQHGRLAADHLIVERVRVTGVVREQRHQLALVHVAVGLGMVGHLILQRAWAPFRMTTIRPDILSGVKGCG